MTPDDPPVTEGTTEPKTNGHTPPPKRDDFATEEEWEAATDKWKEEVSRKKSPVRDLGAELNRSAKVRAELDAGFTVNVPERPWPKSMDRKAYYGPIGQLVDAIDPHTEAEPDTILLQSLVAMGIVFGREPHLRAEGARHPPLLNCCVVADTGVAKGGSYGPVRRVARWVSNGELQTVSNLSTGEGLIKQVQDEETKERSPRNKAEREQVNEQGNFVEVVSGGVTDKRLLVFEGEFGSVLNAGHRQDNNLHVCTEDYVRRTRPGAARVTH